MSVFLSIITPSYNRGHLLSNCFRSLCAQTNKGFEWIIVDDGSTDDTSRIVNSFQPDGFAMRFISKENGGKHTALNTAMEHIRGKYVLILDSDDTLTENAVEMVHTHWKRYEHDPKIGVLTFLRGRDTDSPFCTVRDFNTPVDIMRYRRTVIYGSDCCEVIRADLFLKYPFPVFEGERFISECALWNRVAQTHKCVYINEVIYLCEYLEDGLTKAGRSLRIRNPRGGMFICNLRMHRRNFFSQRVKYAMLYVCYGFFAGLDGKRILAMDHGNSFLKMLGFIPGLLLYCYWRNKYLRVFRP